ncbi:MAG: hypothetical protein MZV64_52595 [Ignavibacteriales bacterium]|nr:hypothetical protein [Ignavibacteriales bacterium]
MDAGTLARSRKASLRDSFTSGREPAARFDPPDLYTIIVEDIPWEGRRAAFFWPCSGRGGASPRSSTRGLGRQHQRAGPGVRWREFRRLARARGFRDQRGRQAPTGRGRLSHPRRGPERQEGPPGRRTGNARELRPALPGRRVPARDRQGRGPLLRRGLPSGDAVDIVTPLRTLRLRHRIDTPEKVQQGPDRGQGQAQERRLDPRRVLPVDHRGHVRSSPERRGRRYNLNGYQDGPGPARGAAVDR